MVVGGLRALIVAILGHKLQIWKPASAAHDIHCHPQRLSFGVKICVTLLHTHGYHPTKFWLNPQQEDGVAIFAHFVRACCLVAKLGLNIGTRVVGKWGTHGIAEILRKLVHAIHFGCGFMCLVMK